MNPIHLHRALGALHFLTSLAFASAAHAVREDLTPWIAATLLLAGGHAWRAARLAAR